MNIYNRAMGAGIPAQLLKSIVGLPVKLSYSKHALRAALNDRNGRVASAPSSIVFTPGNVVEVEAEPSATSPCKVVVRLPQDSRTDLVLVIIPEFGVLCGFVKTLWLNRKSDNHSTLRQDRLASV